jgi:TldD protein
MTYLANWALNRAELLGATYADARVVDTRERIVSTRNGRVGQVSASESLGIGIRVIARGAWGFAATDQLSQESIEAAATRAVEIAHASATAKKRELVLAPENAVVDTWATPIVKDPFATSVEDNAELLLQVDAELRRVNGITLAEAGLNFRRIEQYFASTAGARIHQTRYHTGGGYAAYAFAGSEIQKRSYPNSFGGQFQSRGFEAIEEMRLVENAPRVAEEAVALLRADPCPSGTMDLILDGSQLGLQIHESIGHPIELDRVLGHEANFAGMSFLTLDKLRTLRYGSDVVNVVADARLEHGPGLGTFGYDDEGVPAQCAHIITNGRFTDYITSRETAAEIGEPRSNGCMRAEGWSRIPLIRMSNISLLPGEHTLDGLISSTDRGVWMETNRSWSIDDKRFNFQFGCELAWEIRGGKKTRLLKNPSYSGITTEFWNSCDAVSNREHWTLWGTPNCGKGQPQQVMGTGHGASPARFRNVSVGAATAS